MLKGVVARINAYSGRIDFSVGENKPMSLPASEQLRVEYFTKNITRMRQLAHVHIALNEELISLRDDTLTETSIGTTNAHGTSDHHRIAYQRRTTGAVIITIIIIARTIIINYMQPIAISRVNIIIIIIISV